MTSFKQTRLLSCIVFLYERSMYPFHYKESITIVQSGENKSLDKELCGFALTGRA